jgi:ComF family protein
LQGPGISSNLQSLPDALTQVKGSQRARLWLAGVEGLFATLFPSDCRLCDASLTQISRLPVCLECLNAIAPLHAELCSICGERLFTEEGDGLCGLCRRAQPPFAKAGAFGSYDAGLRDLIALLKYQGVRPAASVLGRMLGEAMLALREHFGERPPVVIPVPLHAQKLRQRGFNQSELLARAALKSFRMAEAQPFDFDLGALARVRITQSQTGLTSHQRRENVRGAFVVARPDKLRGRDILLVDDVFTTGTTVSECARVLRRAGATRVFVATVARVLKPEVTPVTPDASRNTELNFQPLAAHIRCDAHGNR